MIAGAERVSNGAPLDLTYWTAVPGTGGAANQAIVAGANPAGGQFLRQTWTTGATSYGGPSYESDPGIVAAPGEVLELEVWARSSATLTTAAYLIGISGTTGGQLATPTYQVTLNAGVWTRLKFTATPMPANVGRLRLRVYLASPPAGTTLDVAGLSVRPILPDPILAAGPSPLPQRRVELAGVIDQLMPDDVRVVPYRPSVPAPLSGWLQVDQVDREDCTYGEVRLTVECSILVATNRTHFEKVSDSLTPALIAACEGAGGRAVTVTPYTEAVGSSTFYHLSARFITESEAA